MAKQSMENICKENNTLTSLSDILSITFYKILRLWWKNRTNRLMGRSWPNPFIVKLLLGLLESTMLSNNRNLIIVVECKSGFLYRNKLYVDYYNWILFPLWKGLLTDYSSTWGKFKRILFFWFNFLEKQVESIEFLQFWGCRLFIYFLVSSSGREAKTAAQVKFMILSQNL